MSAQPTYQKSVEEELELTSRGGGLVISNESRTVGRGGGVAANAAGTNNSDPNSKGYRKLKTNNFFLPPSLKWMKSNKTAASNSLATSPVIFGVAGTVWPFSKMANYPKVLIFVICSSA